MGTKKHGLLFIIVAVFVTVQKSNAAICPNLDSAPSGYTSNTFSDTSQLLVNPGRGFYIHTETKTSNFHELTETYIVDEQNQHGGPTTVGVVFRQYVLDSFVHKDLTSAVLTHIRNDLEAVKATGIMAILRFSYTVTEHQSPPYGDADKTTILNHIEHLKPIFHDYQGVIAVVQAGFIGTWGEWYYSDHFGVPEHGLSAQNLKDRNDVLIALIAAVPNSIQIQLRTPKYKFDIFGYTATTYSDVQSHAAKARVGHHNDCFLASTDDFGTYEHKTTEYPYLSEDTKYTVMAGETCSLTSVSRHQCNTALNELQMFHWTSINILYEPSVIQYWKDHHCFDEINRRLGYRLKLNSIVLPSATDGTICVKFTLVNEGFAAPIRQYDVKLVLKSSSGHLYTSSPLCGIDTRTWLPGSDHVITGSVTVPSSTPTGSYQMYLEISDKLMAANKAYNIILANNNVIDASLRINSLNHPITVTSTSVRDNSVCPSGLTSVSSPGCDDISLQDGSFENSYSAWFNFGGGFHRVSGDAKDGSYYIDITNGGAYQDVTFPAGTRKFIVKGWSRHQGTISVSNPADYSIYCDVTLKDSTYDWGKTANFDPKSSPSVWQSATLEVTESKDINKARCYGMFRNGSGVAQFDKFEVFTCPV